MGLTCWNGAACSRDCIKPCRPPLDEPAPDWRALLKLYMAHVLHEEGVTYVRGLRMLYDLTPEQGAAISEVETEVKKENPDDCV